MSRMRIRSLAELIERLEDIRADIDSPDLRWADEYVEDMLFEAREYADLEETCRPIVKCGVS